MWIVQFKRNESKGEWMNHKDIHTEYDEALDELKYWRRIQDRHFKYRLVKAEVLDD